jgi:hypothetical protein
MGKARGFTVHRTPEMLKECVSEWVQKKYLHPKKVNRRKALWPGAEWEHILVHATVRYPQELQEIKKRGVGTPRTGP